MKRIFHTTALVLLLASSVIAKVLPAAKVLPTPEEVKSDSIEINYGKDTSGIHFDATAKDWQAIRRHMLPAETDPKPALWEGLAEVKILKKDGKSVRIVLWKPATGSGAFSVGGDYYRGGDSDKLLKAILKAHKKSKLRPLEVDAKNPAPKPNSEPENKEAE
jgi:hypothetical protein